MSDATYPITVAVPGVGTRCELSADVTLWHARCEDVLPLVEGVGGAVLDPPYGLGEHGGACRTRNHPGYAKHENRGWDNETPPAKTFAAVLRLSPVTVIWGGNYFTDKLPVSMGWLYWQKLMGGDFSDGELAWTSRNMALREYTKCPKGIDKQHPCEKPVDLIMWCMDVVSIPQGALVLDPFMGSGTTGVACIRTGRRFVGVECDQTYFNVACRRLQAELNHPRLPFDPPPQPQQQELLANE